MIDPAIDVTLRTSFTVLLLWSAVHKLRDLDAFAAAIVGYRLLPSGIERFAAITFATAELLLAAAWSWPATHPWASVGTTALFVAYSAAIGINLARGRRDVDCGCFGPSHRQSISEWLLVRNFVLLGAVAATLLPVGARGLIWLDALGVAAACLVLAMLWVSANQLLAQWPMVKALRRPA